MLQNHEFAAISLTLYKIAIFSNISPHDGLEIAKILSGGFLTPQKPPNRQIGGFLPAERPQNHDLILCYLEA